MIYAESYLKANIDENCKIKPWLNDKVLPVFLRNNYNFYEMTVLETRCTLIEVIGDVPGLNYLKKHIRQIREITKEPIVLLSKELSSYRRKSLIKNKIPFVIEDGQMYLPFLALDLKKVSEEAANEVKFFSASAQVVFLYFLYHKDQVVNTTKLAEMMGFTEMTASRALNELFRVNLITYELGGKTGRSKEYRRIPDPDYFLNGQQYLKSPVKKVIHTKSKPPHALIAGFDALADLSWINSPSHSIMAMDKKKLNDGLNHIVSNKDEIKDSQFVEVELWDYDPLLISGKRHVDRLSLFLSLKDVPDERVEQALEEIMRGESWYME
ncbi:MarR family transcriptional regulator [Salisediminibacterium beveridgei]|uniref:MarR family protein n=1 Tax=Salisediminibacterium beveridgei TaxID=632773 RepID=A0A1D7QY20_9BACI|nr:MarR family transcriptional regulator [Salisediminibacterium beveridgei]AOM83907.1 hypothetical protein BBEV_2568 [Salisediminibacterium beveridgei]